MQTTGQELSEEQKSLAAALGRIPSGLFILTFRHGRDETAMLASWVQQCSFEPPQIVIAMNAKRFVLDWLVDGAPITVNILGEGQKEIMSHFGKGFEPGQAAFDGIDVERHGKSAVFLPAAHAVLDCRVSSRAPAGDHILIVAQVVAGRVQNEGRPGVHVRRSGLHY
ncbi:MAG: flavin reductase family protein [Planctomycetes bacterium]|nr:flavin reductase family protein [Planctomycetota bacterium]